MRVGCEDKGDSPARRGKAYLTETVKANIMQDRKLIRDFERCTNFYNDFIKQSIRNKRNEARRFAEVGLHKKMNDDVKERYY